MTADPQLSVACAGSAPYSEYATIDYWRSILSSRILNRDTIQARKECPDGACGCYRCDTNYRLESAPTEDDRHHWLPTCVSCASGEWRCPNAKKCGCYECESSDQDVREVWEPACLSTVDDARHSVESIKTNSTKVNCRLFCRIPHTLATVLASASRVRPCTCVCCLLK